jgi:heterodisulfide reductase subunit D
MIDIAQLAAEHGLPAVLDECERINRLCPVAAVNPGFSPELIARLAGQDDSGLLESPLIWDCLACGLCRQATGGRADMSEFIREVRRQAVQEGYAGLETHAGLLLAAQRIEAAGASQADHRSWIRRYPELEVELEVEPGAAQGRSETVYWAGSAPLLAAAFPAFRPTALDSARAAVRLLNFLGIRPLVLARERSSGHDLLWTGDRKGFESLATVNLQALRESGARSVVVSSPEDCYTLKVSYDRLPGGQPLEIRHLSEVIAERVSELQFRPWPHRVCYHDPCRLGRGLGVYEAPRAVLDAIPGLELVEMERTRELAPCCGTSCWIQCTRYSKAMQLGRLQEAAATGAEALVTTCWECALHFRCATRPEAWQQVRMDVRDWTVLVAGQLQE